ncbi:hypothetical protein, conserved [Eimeria acervulina]|uniref:Uncharacterized protein n=1 Tax=Eimeria acervulina TaxID=5801 RepID=U6GPH6_EIMAC|nr:hypothetical protein, conserved [Eimeria acervulina]CDI81173.1 hypothetical protein, conserved [Eimeria acervulina]
MAQRATQYLEQPARGNLPGTRPLSVEEYECLATTHPYAVKHLVTKKVAPGLCADAVKRLPATRLPTALDAANQVQAGKCCSAVGGGRQGSRFLLSDKEAVVRRSIAQGHVRTGAAKTQRMHTNGNVVDLQPYASPPYSTENHETRGFAQFVTGQVGEQQLVSNIAKFPTFDGSSTGRQGIQAVDCFSSGNSKDGRKLILHDCAAVTNPEHYHKDELWQARLSGFHSPVKRTRCPEQTLAYQRSFTRIDKTKSSCPIHHNGENSDSAIVPSLETDPTRQYEFSRDRESARGSGRMGSVGGSHKASADKERCSPGGHEEGSRQREVSGHLGEVQVSGSSKEMRSGRCGADASRDGGETSRSMKATEGGRGEQLREGGGTAEAGASRIFKGNDKVRRVTHPEEQTQLRSSVGSSMRNTAFTGTEPANSGEFVCTSSGGTGYRSSELKARSQQNADGRPPSERRGFAAGVSEGDMRRVGPNVSDQAMHVVVRRSSRRNLYPDFAPLLY